MQILSKGYKLPDTGDFGDTWFPALEDNINRINSHSHDGTNSEKLTTTSMEAIVSTIASGDFAASGSEFFARITLAGGVIDIDKKHVIFRDPTTKEPIYLRYIKHSTTQIDVFTSFVQDIEVLVL